MDYKQAIKESGLKMNFIAGKLGIHYSYLSHFLAGRRNLPPEKIVKLKQIVGIREEV